MNKKIKAIILLMIMGALSACGNGNKNTNAPATTAAPTVPATSPATTEPVTGAPDTTVAVTATPTTEASVSSSEASFSSPVSKTAEREVTSAATNTEVNMSKASETMTTETYKDVETTMSSIASKAQSSASVAISSASETQGSGMEKTKETLKEMSIPLSVPASSSPQPAKNISSASSAPSSAEVSSAPSDVKEVKSASSVPESAKNISMSTEKSAVSVPVKVTPINESNASPQSSSTPLKTSGQELTPVNSSSSMPVEKKISSDSSVSSNASGTLKPVSSSQSSSSASNSSSAGESKGSGVEVIQDEMIEKVKLKFFDADKKLYKFSSALFMSPGEEFKGYRQGDYVGFEKNENEYMGFFKFPKNSEKPVTQEDLDAVYKSMYQNIEGAGKKAIFADKEGKPVVIYEGTADYKGETLYFKNYFIGNGREIYAVTSVAESMGKADANLNKFVNSLSFTE